MSVLSNSNAEEAILRTLEDTQRPLKGTDPDAAGVNNHCATLDKGGAGTVPTWIDKENFLQYEDMMGKCTQVCRLFCLDSTRLGSTFMIPQDLLFKELLFNYRFLLTFC